MPYVCHTCGRSHEDIPLSFAADFPDEYFNMSLEERDNRCVIASDQCIIDGETFFLRGCLEIPLHDSDAVFMWGLWAKLWEKDFDEISEAWEEQGREKRHGPFKARLANKLAVYPNTRDLRITIRIQPVGQRPLFFVDEDDHPLAIAQRAGMSGEETQSLVARVLHPEGQLH